jgi:regulator of sirC expression with transglutaminase-like and TPR domain
MNLTTRHLLIGLFAISSWASIASYVEAASYFSPTLEKIFAQPTDDIDVGRAALEIAKLRYPMLDVDAYSRRIDDLARQTKELAGGHAEPAIEAAALGAVLYGKNGFHYAFDRDAHMVESNYFINGLLDTKQGFCEDMTALYIAVAQRAGFRVFAVGAPWHVFARFTGPGPQQSRDVDPSSGNATTDTYYINRFRIPQQDIDSGAYLRTLSNRELLGYLLMTSAQAMRPTVDDSVRARTIVYFERAADLHPRGLEVMETLRGAYEYEAMMASIHRDMETADIYRKKADDLYTKTERLGYVGPTVEELLE